MTRARPPRGERRGDVRLALAARLPWLGCYPAAAADGALELRDPVTDARHVLDRAGLAAATRAVKQLVRDHRDALAVIVGDVDDWQAGVMARLDAFKPAVHDGAPPPSPWTPALHDASSARRGRALAAAAPALADAVDALGWIHAGDRGALAASLGWLERRRDPLARAIAPPLPPVPVANRREPPPPRRLVVLLRHLARTDGDRLVDPLIDALAEPTIHTATPTGTGHVLALRDRIARAPKNPLARPVARAIGPELLALVPALPSMATADRRNVLRAIAAARLPELARRWHGLWQRLEAVARRLGGPRAPDWTTLVALHGEVDAIARELPGDVEVPALARELREPTAPLVEVVAAMPDVGDPGAHAELLLALHRASHRVSELEGIAALITATIADDATRWPRLWTRVLAGLVRRSSLPVPADPAQGRVAGAALATLLADDDPIVLDEIIVLARHRPDAASVLAYQAVWRKHARLRVDEVELALRLTTTPAELAAFAPTAGRLSEDDVTELSPLVEALAAPAAPTLYRLLLAGEGARLRDAARLLALAAVLRQPAPPWPAPTDAALDDDLRRYPAELHPLLARLAAAGAAAQAAAILDDTFPDPRATARELAAIEARLAGGAGDARLVRRADNLRARLAAPPAASPARLERLHGKLERAADVAAFARWQAALRAAIEPRLLDALGLDATARPAWLDDPAYQRVFTGIVTLAGGTRMLARRLLAARTGPPPWDLRDAPYNRAWLAKLRARGVDPAPWLDGIGVHTLGHPRALRLALEDDPLEALRMGEHFSTCLAPTSFNFFAAVVDAAEVNKRVLYGRDDEGRVVGRCLLALTDGGGLVTFQPYCHARVDFAAMVRTFVGELARRMGTVVLPAGSIAALSGNDWYDDGPHDLTGAFEFLADGSPFRAALADLPADRVLDELAARFAPLPLGGHTLTLFVELRELDARPALVVPCLPLLDASDEVPREVRLRAARLAERAGRGDLVGDRFVERMRPTERWFHADLDALDLLAPRAPARLLAWLREVEDDVTSYDRPMWDYGRGLALAALRRPAQAAAALRAAIRGPHKETRARARARMRALALEHPRAVARHG